MLLLPVAVSHALKMVLAGAALLAAAAILQGGGRGAEQARNRNQALARAFALLWIVLTLAPYTISNFSPALSITRYLYLALAGFALLYAVAVSAAAQRWARWRYPVWGAAGLLPLAHLWASFRVVH